MNIQQKSKTGFGAVIAAICIVIYLFALVQATVRLYLSIDKCRDTAEQEFTRIANITSTAGQQSFMDERFIQTVNNALSSSAIIEALIIAGPEGEYAFERQQGRAIRWVNNSPRYIDRLTFSNENYYRQFQINGQRNANITAVAETFDYNVISRILKETLLIILLGFAIAFFTMLLQVLLGKTAEKPAPVYTPAYKPSFEQPSKQKTQEIFEAATENETAAFGSGPKGLYSSRSNIGWEEYLNDRLDSELHRCSSTENDLTLILLEFMDIKNDIMYKQAAEEAAAFFSSRDLLFETGTYGIAAILPSIDLDTGIAKSEKFYQRILEKFPNSYSSSSPSLCIGLSSRSGRLLKAERLLFESREALQKAQNDPKSSIVAFKSDPDKYRDFISKRD